jgi:hypothetical protein
MYLRARDEIAAVDPSARVILGGITHPEAFLPKMLRARGDLVGHVDGVGIHPYGANPLVVLGRVRAARRVLDSVGMATVPLYVTEFGWATQPPGVFTYAPASVRPGYISTTLRLLGHTNCAIAGAELYTWVTPEQNPGNKEDWYGIHPPGGGESPDTDAFTAGLRAAAHPGKTLHLC